MGLVRPFLLIVLLAVLGLIWPRSAAAAPALTYEEQAVVVSGVTPQGQVVWFSLAKQIEGYMAHFVTRRDLLADTDGDGVVRFELDRTVPLQSIWVAVDLASGEAVVGTPEGYPLRDASEPPGHGRGEPGRPDWVTTGRQMLELLVVRPGQGAWTASLLDGGGDDDDHGADGRLTASLARLHAVGASPAPPERFQGKDLVFALDPDRMEIVSERVPAAQQP
jgi:hypothetical protein